MEKDEDRSQRFKRLASLRTNSVLLRLKVLGNCANRQAYEYTEEDVKRIFSTIEEQLKVVKSRFHFHKDKQFKL